MRSIHSTKVNISMDCTESQGYICYNIYKLTNFQVKLATVCNVYIHLGLVTLVTPNEAMTDLFIMHEKYIN